MYYLNFLKLTYAPLSFPLTSQTPTNNVARVNAKKSLENQRNKGLYGGEKIMKEPFAF